MLLDQRERAQKPRIVGLHDAEFRHQEKTGVDLPAPEALNETVQPGIPGTFQNLASDGIRMAFPIGPTFRYAETRRDPCEPVARSPAHDARQGMHAAARPEFPQTGVGLVP